MQRIRLHACNIMLSSHKTSTSNILASIIDKEASLLTRKACKAFSSPLMAQGSNKVIALRTQKDSQMSQPNDTAKKKKCTNRTALLKSLEQHYQ